MTDGDIARLSASEVACYEWPEDTREHKALRAAFMEGAAHTVTHETMRLQRLCDAAAREINELRDALKEIAAIAVAALSRS
jgi:hypothetical protein